MGEDTRSGDPEPDTVDLASDRRVLTLFRRAGRRWRHLPGEKALVRGFAACL
jgi:hypothetical protein